VALVLDGDGFIRRHRIFNGKMTDVKSLDKILIALEDDFKDKPMPTIIFDRGMVSDDNLKLLNKYDNLKSNKFDPNLYAYLSKLFRPRS